GVKSQHHRLDVLQLGFLDVFRIGDNDFVATLAGACRSAVQDAAARAALAVDHVGADAGAGVLVPDVHEFHGQDAGGFAVVGVQGDGAVVIQVGPGDADAMQLGADDFSHLKSGRED